MPQPRTIPTNRPATVVTPVILIEGHALAHTWLVDSITVRKEVNRLPWARIVILDGDAAAGVFAASAAPLFVPGHEIEVRCGYQNETFPLFKGLIVNHAVKLRSDAGAILVLDCRDQTIKMTIGRKSRYFANLTDSEMIRQIVGDYHGLTTHTEASSVTHKELVQYHCSDWDFILARAEANGKICLADDGTFTVQAPVLNQSPVLALQFGATILELDAEIDARQQLAKVTSRSWDLTGQKLVSAAGTDPNVRLGGNLSPAQLAAVAAPADYCQDHGGRLEAAELQAWSDALLLKRQLAKVRGRVRCKGIHTVKPGNLIQMAGISERFDGNAFVSGVQHTIAAGDWTLDIQFGLEPEWFTATTEIGTRPAAGLLSALHGLQIGVVTRIDRDPDGEHRIKVRLPIISETEEGIWARLATLDAGNGRGSFFLPEVGDEVIVGFVNDDPRDAVVLGMLHSSALPAPMTAEESNPRKGFVTRSRLQLLFDDDKKIFSVETPTGKKIVLNEDDDTISIRDDHQNRLVMDKEGIVIESQGRIEITARKELALVGLDTHMKAHMSLTVESLANTEVKAGGTLAVKGAMVQIN